MILEEKDGGISFSIILAARSSRTTICGLQGDFIRIKVVSPPVDNRANTECIELLSKIFSKAKSSIRILHGSKGRRKKIYIDAITAKRAREILNEHIM